MATRGTEPRNKFTAFRLTESEHAAIHKQAQARDMSMTEYVVRAALGDLPEPSETVQRVAELERKVDRLEKLAELGSFG